MAHRALGVSLLGIVAWGSVACGGPSQVTFVSTERPSTYNVQGSSPEVAPGPPEPRELEREDAEPSPAADTKEERALVHVHGPDGTCSGVLVAPRIVATAQQCAKGEPKGPAKLAAGREYQVEVVSSTLTWTKRKVTATVLPECDWGELDVALLVLAEPAPAEPLRIVIAPDTGAQVTAMGLGRCKGSAPRARPSVVQSRRSGDVTIDVGMCTGDVGGAVVDGTDLIGLMSRRDDPEGSPLRTTMIARMDTIQVGEMLAQARALVGATGDPAALKPVACR